MKILITDDHAVVRQGYAALLRSMLPPPVEILEADSGDQACRLHRDQQPALIIMDINLPGISGIEVTRRICERDRNARILVFSMHEEVPLVEQAMDAGAKGYITKSCDPDILIEAVKQVARGERYVQNDLLLRLAFQQPRVPEERLGEMTQREFEIFGLLARGFNISQIADQLCLSAKTVANYSSQLKNKLQVRNTAELVHLAINAGVIKVAHAYQS